MQSILELVVEESRKYLELEEESEKMVEELEEKEREEKKKEEEWKRGEEKWKRELKESEEINGSLNE